MTRSLSEIYYSLALDPGFRKHGATDKGTVHSYIDVYEGLFAPYRYQNPIKVLEIGIGGCGSLLLWDRYFEHAVVHGAEIHEVDFFKDLDYPEDMRTNDRIKVFFGDATNAYFVNSKLSNYDIIIDDGSHISYDQITSFNLLFPKLNTGGLYIIEDIDPAQGADVEIRSTIPNCEIIDLRHVKGRFDDVLAIIRK